MEGVAEQVFNDSFFVLQKKAIWCTTAKMKCDGKWNKTCQVKTHPGTLCNPPPVQFMSIWNEITCVCVCVGSILPVAGTCIVSVHKEYKQSVQEVHTKCTKSTHKVYKEYTLIVPLSITQVTRYKKRQQSFLFLKSNTKHLSL